MRDNKPIFAPCLSVLAIFTWPFAVAHSSPPPPPPPTPPTVAEPVALEPGDAPMVDVEVAPAVPAADEVQQQPVSVPAPTQDRDDEGSSESEQPSVGPLGSIGIGVAVVGFGMTFIGGSAWSRGQVPDIDLTQPVSEGRDYTHRGQVLVGVGVGAVLVGTILLLVDLDVQADRLGNGHRAHLVPVVGPEQSGIVLRGKF